MPTNREIQDREFCTLGPGGSLAASVHASSAAVTIFGNSFAREVLLTQECLLTQEFLSGSPYSFSPFLLHSENGDWNPTPQEALRIKNGSRLVTDVEVVALAQAPECDPCWLLVND